MGKTLLYNDPNDWSDTHNTKLSSEDEKKFQKWAKANGRLGDVYDYDIRGAWKEITSGDMKQADNGHLGDRYKKPNHPTFSNQSIYHGVGGAIGGEWSETPEGVTVFTPSETNLKNMTPKQLRNYFDKVEPNVLLNIPYSLAEKLYPNEGD